MSTNTPLERKAEQAQIIFEELADRFGIQTIPTTFVADGRRVGQFARACVEGNPFPGLYQPVLVGKRVPAVKKLFADEIIPQSAAIGAVLAACSSVATNIGKLRGDDVRGAETYCDLAFAGLQAIRVYMADHGGKEFKKLRFESASRVNNAINGSFYKYRAADGRDVSFHAYYQSSQKRLVEALKMKKPSEEYGFFTTKKDKKELAEVVSRYKAIELENLAYDNEVCGCMIRSREEWEATEVGKAVVEMPLIREAKVSDCPPPDWGKPNSRGPLSGIKVLDLTHIIAGPACTRVLAEYGADVLLVRRGDYMHQEQSMVEFDDWAGKQSIQLDFNIPAQLERTKELVREADVICYSYQNGSMDKFGLSEADIRALNPNVIYVNLMAFSDSVWKDRPGWAPCAEDITGLSVRNGSLEKPVNLNGVPLDYFPGFILALGALRAIERKLAEGGGHKVTTSLARGAQYLHECADLLQRPAGKLSSAVSKQSDMPEWDKALTYVSGCAACGRAGFPGPATVNTAYPLNLKNLRFTDGNTGWTQG